MLLKSEMQSESEHRYIFILLSNPEKRAYLVVTRRDAIIENHNLALFSAPNLVERMQVTSKSKIKIELLEIVEDMKPRDMKKRKQIWYRKLEDDFNFFNKDYGNN